MWALFGEIVKTKELGPVGGSCARHAPLDPPMQYKPLNLHDKTVFPRSY